MSWEYINLDWVRKIVIGRTLTRKLKVTIYYAGGGKEVLKGGDAEDFLNYVDNTSYDYLLYYYEEVWEEW